MIDIERLREETPGCRNIIHFNNAGAALPPRPVLDTVVGHLRRESEIGEYEAADEAKEAFERCYGGIARLVNGAPEEVAFVENATRAWDMAFYSLRLGSVVVQNDSSGQLSVEALEASIDQQTKLIAVTHVPTNGGLVNPAEEIGAVARRHNIPFLLDACQSVGQMPVDVANIGCDMRNQVMARRSEHDYSALDWLYGYKA